MQANTVDSAKNEKFPTIHREGEGPPEAIILALKLQTNRHAPIAQLPAEILCKIFYFVKVEEQHALQGNVLKWVTVSHVCSHWRSIAINFASLWDTPPLGNADWVAEMLERSKMVALSIEVSRVRKKMMEGLEKIVQYDSIGSRIRHLSIVDLGGQTARAMRCLPTSMPRLEILRVDPVYWPGEDVNSFRDLLYVPSGVLDAEGCLRRLELSYCTVDWRLLLPPQITHLKLHAIPLNARPTLTQIMVVLGRLAKLESLDIVNAYDIENTPCCDRIHLEHLRRLNVSSPDVEIVAFLRHVTFSPRATVAVCSQYDTSNTTRTDSAVHFSALFAALAQSYTPSVSLPHFRTFVARGESVSSAHTLALRLGLFSSDAFSEHEWSSDDSQQRPSLSILLKWRRATLPYPQGTSRALSDFHNSGFPLHAVTHIHLLRFIQLTPTALASTLGMLPAVRSVSVQRKAGNALVYALNLPSGGAVPPFHFAHLAEIRLHALAFHPPSSTRRLSDSVSAKRLRDCLAHRRERGAEIKRLALVHCTPLVAADVVELKRVVTDVYWDAEHPIHALGLGELI
ncbi:hypothetical protein HYPSUDRAFT_197548 [Hypholoma sublateritium FD-334 SS-4]|uniref:F-box domain-containing protein n=1 Tax=Hypholoma sublateritium (strain FD-334 SS-4) TaxID=945553 RepID=A0A0D2PAQ6_HYPSF|nr:hypothetical protein HYPSUDRAFT_197548 [Hypholoma sublateritium FD-334 SS-4]